MPPLKYSVPVLLSLTLLALPLWGACAVPLDYLVVETEVQELCIVDLATDFHGAQGADGAEGAVSQVLGGDELGIELSEKFSSSMFLRGIGVSPLRGVDSIDFIERLRVVVSGGGQEPALLMDYATLQQEADALFVESTSAVDIAVFLEADDLEFLVEFEGAVPEDAWAANLEVCLSAQATYRESL